MVRVRDILAYLDKIAPMSVKMDMDNIGLLVGSGEAEVRRALVALDITDEVIDEAVELGATLIVTHHPLFLQPLWQVTDGDRTGSKIIKLLRHGISAICMHTNLDIAEGGINDRLAEAVGLADTTILWQMGEADGVPYGMGRVGTLAAPVAMADFLSRVKAALEASGLRYHDAGRPVQRVAVLGGSGSNELWRAVAAGCDTYLLGEAKHSGFVEAQELGVNLIEGDHYCTENVISEPLKQELAAAFPAVEVTVSARQGQVARFF